jgi:electron transport complex protein RnfC
VDCIQLVTVAEPIVESAPTASLPCIRCGDCVDACPMHLMPQLLHASHAAQDWPALEKLAVHSCIECARCDSVCPSRIPLATEFRQAKWVLKNQQEERRQTELARQRYQARAARLQEEQQERARQLALRKSSRQLAPEVLKALQTPGQVSSPKSDDA